MEYTRTYRDGPYLFTETSGGNFARSSEITYVGTRSGQRNENFRALIAANQSAGSPFTSDRQRLRLRSDGDVEIKELDPRNGKITGARYTGHHVSTQAPSVVTHASGASLTQAEAIALAKTYAKIRKEQEHMNSPAVLGEFLGTVRLFKHPFAALVELTNRHVSRLELAKRGLSGTVAFKRLRYSEIVASSYLEWVFGLQPIISDTVAAAEALARFRIEQELRSAFRARIRSRGSSSVVEHTTGELSGANTSLKFRYSSRKETEKRVQYVCGLSLDPVYDLGSEERLIQLLGFNHANWIPALWEATPWSWLADYFTNIQQILEACATTTTGVKWIVRTETTYTKLVRSSRLDAARTAQVSNGKPYNVLVYLSGGENAHCGITVTERTTMARTIPSSLGIPPLALEHPFRDFKKVANMAAVLLARGPSATRLDL